MANKFQIVISAVDKATATVRKINASIGKITAPITKIKNSASALGKELGIDKFGKELVNVGQAAGDVAGKVGSIIAPLAAIVGGGTLAGTAALATEWARFGSEVNRTAQGLGITATELQALRGAATVAGLSSEQLTSSIKSLGDTMEDALYGRNLGAMAMLNRLGVGIHQTANGSIDAARGVKELANAIAGISNVQAQGLVARTFGIESLLPLLRKGARGIEEYEQKVAELGGIRSQSAINAAEQFALRLNYLSVATQGVRDSIGERLLPILQPLLDRFTDWISKNRELIATKVEGFVKGLAKWLGRLDLDAIVDGIEGLIEKIGELIDWMGGWKNAALALVVVMNGSLIASVINLGIALTRMSLASIPIAIRAVGLLGAAIEATPIGWLITGIVAIGASVYAIYKNWDNIVDYFREKIDGIKKAFDKGWTGGVVKALWEFAPVKILADAFNGLSKWLFDIDLYAAGEHMIASLVRGMKGLASKLPKSVQKLVGIDGWAASDTPEPKSEIHPQAAKAKDAKQAGQSATGKKPVAGNVDDNVSPYTSWLQSISTVAGKVPRGISQNNPGNLRSWPGAPSINGYAAFADPSAGIRAMVQNLQSYQNKHGINTISGVIRRWAPPSENNTGAYIGDVARQTGMDPNASLNLNDPKVVAPLISSMIRHENGQQPYSPDMINQIVASQLGGAQQQVPKIDITVHAPAGTKVTARNRNGGDAPVRVSYAMPTMVTP